MCEKKHVMMPDSLIADTKEGKVIDSTGKKSQKSARYSMNDAKLNYSRADY